MSPAAKIVLVAAGLFSVNAAYLLLLWLITRVLDWQAHRAGGRHVQ